MLRRCVSAIAMLFVLCGFVVGGMYNVVITKMDKESMTVKILKKGEKPEEKTFKISKDVKYGKGKKGAEEATAKDVADAITAGAETKAKGAKAKIETEGEGDKEVVTKITLPKAK